MATTIESVAVVPGSLLHHSARKLADRAIEDALAAASIQPHDVDLLVNAGIFHDRILGEPAMAALIQEDVGANPEDPHGEGHGTFSFDIANGSAGVLSALQPIIIVPIWAPTPSIVVRWAYHPCSSVSNSCGLRPTRPR